MAKKTETAADAKKPAKTANEAAESEAFKASRKATTDFNKAQAEAKGETYGDEETGRE